MTILALRTDKERAEIHVLDAEGSLLSSISWQAHRELSRTIHSKVDEALAEALSDKKDIDGIIVFSGAGSFTGLRIGFAVANAFGYAAGFPVVASGGDDWLASGLQEIRKRTGFEAASPVYSSPVHITEAKK